MIEVLSLKVLGRTEENHENIPVEVVPRQVFEPNTSHINVSLSAPSRSDIVSDEKSSFS
jgi:hypothetical protein